MNNTTSKNNIPSTNSPAPEDIISANLKKLISQTGTTQKELAEKLGVAPASMSDYCNGRRIPNVEFFLDLKRLYNISIDDFLTKSINPIATSASSKASAFDSSRLSTYQKYCGLYYAYYFDTSKYKGRDNLSEKASLLYGVLYIYENPTSLETPEFSCAAILGIKDRESASNVKSKLEALKNSSKIINYIENNYPCTAYYGDFDMSNDHAFISISHDQTDKALLILHRVESNQANYIGGIGTINSISKGRERMPVIQFIGLSRYPLSMSVEEIHHSLLLTYPTFKAETEAEEMIKVFKNLFSETNENKEGFSDYQKTIMVKSTLERFIKQSLERNMFRYGKISERDDDEWYHAMKASSKEE